MAPRPILSAVTVTIVGALLGGCVLLPPLTPERHGVENLEAGKPLLGAWLGMWPTASRPIIEEFERRADVKLDLVDVYLDWYTPWDNVSHTVEWITMEGSIPVLTWEAHGFTTRDIVAGTKETYLRDGRSMPVGEYLDEMAEGVCKMSRKTETPIFIRVLHEFNGNWFAWGITYEDENGERPNDDESYKRAWGKIRAAFVSRCPPDGVKFVWAVNHFSVGEGATFTGPYPGDTQVDFVGIDGYNWGDNAGWGWQSFDEIFYTVYCAVAAASGRDILVAETASSEKGGDKAAWVEDMWDRFRAYPRLRGLVYFHDAKYEIEIDGRMDWPVDSSPAALRSFRDGAKEIKNDSWGEDRPGSPC